MTSAQDHDGGESPGLGDWITTDEAAALADVAPDTLRHYARHGQAPAPQKFGRSLVWEPPQHPHLDALPARARIPDRPAEPVTIDLLLTIARSLCPAGAA